MHDAFDHFHAIAARKESWASTNESNRYEVLAAAIKEYEASMFKRGEENAQETSDNLNDYFKMGGTEAMVKLLKQHIVARVGEGPKGNDTT